MGADGKRVSRGERGRARGIGRRDERGFVVLIVLILILLLTVLGLAANRNIITDTGIAANHTASVQALYAAEAGANLAYNQLYQALATLNPAIPTPQTPAMAGYTWTTTISTVPAGGPNIIERPATGTFAGLTAFVQSYRITSTATEAKTNAVSTVTIDVEDQLIPIFQFGVFYNSILEIFPGANMTFTGWIHSNSDLYLGSNGATLQINSNVTTAQNIFDYRLDSSAAVNPANIYKTGASTTFNTTDYPPENHDSVTDSNHNGIPDWVEDHYASAWDGGVRTQYEGITALNVPMPTSNPYDIIGTGTGSLYQQAGLKIIDGVGYDEAGNNLNWCSKNTNYKKNGTLIIDPGCNSTNNQNPVVTAGTVYDYREGTTMNTLDVNMSALATYTAAKNALVTPPTGDDPGILYVSSSSTDGAVRLVNGSTLPQNVVNGQAAGLTVTTPNPLYVLGNYNSTSTVPAALISDALTILSNNWGNSSNNWGNGINGAGTSLSSSSRTATATTVNAAVMSGNINTAGSQYSGGLENFMRFLENWSNVTYTYNGSLVCLWQSQQATAPWPGTGTVYNPPTRNWSFSMVVNNLPPGTPRVRITRRVGWSSN
jgi:Tfp pilus assembly protein PilX